MSDRSARVIHPFAPVWAPDSRVLILGTLPSRESRKRGFYYGHPQNRFWPLLAALCNEPVPEAIAGRQTFLIRHGIALWDVLQSCEIRGSQDQTIRAAQANDIQGLLERSAVQAIFANGQAAANLYRTLCLPATGRPCVALPSTSSANGRYSLDKLLQDWQPLAVALDK
jgi:double-stranded uracil-DNA glycosylase